MTDYSCCLENMHAGEVVYVASVDDVLTGSGGKATDQHLIVHLCGGCGEINIAANPRKLVVNKEKFDRAVKNGLRGDTSKPFFLVHGGKCTTNSGKCYTPFYLTPVKSMELIGGCPKLVNISEEMSETAPPPKKIIAKKSK